jgi:predicted nucleic acid-binding Zn ribbon protein
VYPDRSCGRCGQTYSPRHPNAKWCGAHCYRAAAQDRQRQRKADHLRALEARVAELEALLAS